MFMAARAETGELRESNPPTDGADGAATWIGAIGEIVGLATVGAALRSASPLPVSLAPCLLPAMFTKYSST